MPLVALPEAVGKLPFVAELPTPGVKLFPGLVVTPLLNLVVVLPDELTTPGARVVSTLAVGLGKVVVGAKGLAVTGSGRSGTWLTVFRFDWRWERAIVLIIALAPTTATKVPIFCR